MVGNLAKIGEDIGATGVKSLEQLVKDSAKELGRSLPEFMRPERIVQIALTCIRQNPELAKCTPASFLGALFVSAQLGLEPIAGNAYILPFNNNKKSLDGRSWIKVKEAQFIIGYRGLANLFFRHEKSVQMTWGVVHEKDDFNYQYGTDAYLKHIPAKDDRGQVKGFYVIGTLQNGGKPFMYMTLEDCMAHGKKHSKTYSKKIDEKTGKEFGFSSSSPWVTNTEAMCLKTVLIQLSKLLPLSMELQQAISVDETSPEYRKGIDNAMDFKDTSNWDEHPAVEEAKEQNPVEEPKKETGGLEPATLPQCQKLHILLDELKLTEEDFYKQVNTHYTINIASTKSLTKLQASEVIEELQTQADKVSKEGKKETTESKLKYTCFDCAEEKKVTNITDAEYNYSSTHFARGLCRKHQDIEKEKNKEE